jgi:hypothetical protein
MAYGDFTLDQVRTAFAIQVVEQPDLFGTAPDLAPSDWLAALLKGGVPLARAVNTEKARSELIIAPVLAELRLRFPDRCSWFSGVELNADPARGLRGYCDFIVSRSAVQHLLDAPILLVAEAKNADLATGYGQCAAGMVGAQVFNEQKGRPPGPIYGAVTTGETWAFLKLEATTLTLDMQAYPIDRLPKVLGILREMVVPA